MENNQNMINEAKGYEPLRALQWWSGLQQYFRKIIL